MCYNYAISFTIFKVNLLFEMLHFSIEFIFIHRNPGQVIFEKKKRKILTESVYTYHYLLSVSDLFE